MDEYKTYKNSATTNDETAVSCSHRKATLVQRLLRRERDISNQVTSRAVFEGKILNNNPTRAVFRSKLEPTSIIQVKFYKCWQKELRMMSTGHCPVSVLIVQSQWLSWYSVLNCQNCNQCLKGHHSPVSKIALWKCSRHVFDFVFVFDFLFVFLLVGPCLVRIPDPLVYTTKWVGVTWLGHVCSSLWSKVWVYDTLNKYMENLAWNF